MRYAPYEVEYAQQLDMNPQQRLEYFLTRIFETEEIWGLDDGLEWITVQKNEQTYLPLWPYRRFAQEFCEAPSPELGQNLQPRDEALDIFMQESLPMMEEEGIMLELIPSPTQSGSVISPANLLAILQGMVDAGEYRLEG